MSNEQKINEQRQKIGITLIGLGMIIIAISGFLFLDLSKPDNGYREPTFYKVKITYCDGSIAYTEIYDNKLPSSLNIGTTTGGKRKHDLAYPMYTTLREKIINICNIELIK